MGGGANIFNGSAYFATTLKNQKTMQKYTVKYHKL
jgi:hypothetical protein